MRAYRFIQTTHANARARRAAFRRIDRLYADRIAWIAGNRTAVWIGPSKYNDAGEIQRQPTRLPRRAGGRNRAYRYCTGRYSWRPGHAAPYRSN